MRESRSQVIAAHVALALSRSSIIERTYAQQVADLYMERTPLHARTVDFHASRDPYEDSKANCQIVKRMLDGKVRMPVDVEEALVLALPKPYREHLQAELAGRLGLLAGPLPACKAGGQQYQIGTLLERMGATVQRLSSLLDDGVIDERDADKAGPALEVLGQLQGELVTVRAAIRTHALHQPASEALEPTD